MYKRRSFGENIMGKISCIKENYMGHYISNPSPRDKNIVWLNVLRVLATIGVVVIHTASGMISNLNDLRYILEIYQALCRWCVPVFIMISGFLFLNSSKSFRKILSQNFLRLLTVFIFWTIFFDVLLLATKKAPVLFYFHLWFLPMLAGLYLLIPFLRVIVKQRKLLQYFLILWGITAILLPQLLQSISTVSSTLAIILYKYNLAFQLYFPMGYSGYFLLGYYLGTEDFSAKSEKLIYGLAVISIMVCFMTDSSLLFYIDSHAKECLTPYVLFLSAGVFVFARYHCDKIKSTKGLTHLAKWSFGVYLIHPLIYSLLHRIGIEYYMGNPAYSVFLFSILIVGISFILSGILNTIPFCKKYIV